MDHPGEQETEANRLRSAQRLIKRWLAEYRRLTFFEKPGADLRRAFYEKLEADRRRALENPDPEVSGEALERLADPDAAARAQLAAFRAMIEDEARQDARREGTRRSASTRAKRNEKIKA